MNYAEYKAFIESTDIDQNLYRSLLKDAVSADADRLGAILDVFMSLNVPENYDGDVDEIKAEGLAEIGSVRHGNDMLKYAELFWALPTSVSDALFHALEQLIEM